MLTLNRISLAVSILSVSAALITGCGGSTPEPDPTPTPAPAKVSVTSVSISQSSLTLVEGDSQTLTATVSPSNATDPTVTWQSSGSVVSVDGNGKVTALKEGSATVTVTTSDGGKTASCKVTVEAKVIPVTGIALDKEALELVEGEEFDLTVTVEPGDATDKTFSLETSDETVVAIQDGKLIAIGVGTAKITARTHDGEKTATCVVTVTPKEIPATGITLETETLEMVEDDEYVLTVTVEPEDATDKTFSLESSDETVVTIQDGKLVAVGAGTATITAKTNDGEKTATCVVTVAPKVIHLERIEMIPESISIRALRSESIGVRFFPDDAEDKTVTWVSTDESIAWPKPRPNQPYVCDVQAVNPGEVTIIAIAADGGLTARCNVTVTPIPLEGVQLQYSSVRVYVGNTITWEVGYMPTVATNKNVTWKVADPSIASVDQNGVITGLSPGKTIVSIVSEDGGFTSEQELLVEEVTVKISSISLDRTSLSMVAGSEEALLATISPSDATSKEVNWYSSDNTVAWVSNQGIVKAYGVGTCDIVAVYAADVSYRATCKVTVTASPSSKVSGVILSNSALTLNVGGSGTLYAYISPSTATNKDVTWSSSDASVVKVDNRGNVTALKTGSAVITVKTFDGGYTAKCSVKVQTQIVLPQSITLDRSSITLDKGSKIRLTATISPSNVTNPNVSWKSENTSVAKVDASGTVTAVGVGATRIIVSADANGTAATCVVSVKSYVKSISISGSSTVSAYSTIQLKATVSPSDASSSVTWSSSNSSIATVDQSGNVKGLKEGKVTISAAATDGSGAVGTRQVTVTKAVATYLMLGDSYVETGDDLNMLVGEYRSFSVTVYPREVSPEVTWTCSNTNIVEIRDYQGSNSKYTRLLYAKKAGTCTITLEAKDGGGAKRTFRIVVKDQ